MGCLQGVGPLHRLVAASAGKAAKEAQLIFALDQRLADCWRLTNESMIGQIRLAWWRDALSGEAAPGEPLATSLRALPQFETMRPHLIAMVNGWEEWIVRDESELREALLPFAQQRGAGLFLALGEAVGVHADGGGTDAGAIWALWDLAGQIREDSLRNSMLALAFELATGTRGRRGRLPKPAAMLARLSRADVLGGRNPPMGMTPGLYLRTIVAQFLAR